MAVSSVVCAPAGMPLRRTPSLHAIKKRRSIIPKMTKTERMFILQTSSLPSYFYPSSWLFRKRESDFRVRAEQWRSLEQGCFGRNLRQIRIVRALRQVRQNYVFGLAIKPVD